MYRYKLKIKEEEGLGPKQFQSERMLGFDKIGDLLGQIQPLLNDAKQETEQYYKENPDSYSVVYGTDLIHDYLNDILKILKPEE
jgi:hypothetical protein